MGLRVYGIAKQIVHLSTRGRRRTTWSDGYMVQEWVTQGMKRSIDNAQRPGRGSMMRPTINEESDCLRKKILHCHYRSQTVRVYITKLKR